MKYTYDIISLGAGVQSSVMLLLADRGELPGYDPQCAIFADTGWEPAAVYRHLDWLEGEVNLPIHRVTGPGNLKEMTVVGKDHGGKSGFSDIPHFVRHSDGTRGTTARHCTTHWKVNPVKRLGRQLAGLPAPPARPPIGSMRQMMGITCDEAHRMKDSREQYIINAYPLIDLGWRREDCVRWFADRYPGRQLPKSACLGCPYHSDAYWVELYRRGGQEWLDTVAVDNAMADPGWAGFPMERRASAHSVPGLHAKGRLETIVPELARRQRMQPALFDTEPGFGAECDGYCSI